MWIKIALFGKISWEAPTKPTVQEVTHVAVIDGDVADGQRNVDLPFSVVDVAAINIDRKINA